MELLRLALALAVAEEPERSAVEEAQQLNVELEELLTHLRSLPAPESQAQDIELDATSSETLTPTDTAAPTAEAAPAIPSQRL